MTAVSYSPFIIKPIGDFKCSDIAFDKRYILIKLAKKSQDHCNYVAHGSPDDEWDGEIHNPIMKWRMHTRGEFIKLYWPTKSEPEYIENDTHVQIIFLKYRTIFRCIIRLMVLKKRAHTRIMARKNLKIANLFHGLGHMNLYNCILNFV
jgi:hypothetical protein